MDSHGSTLIGLKFYQENKMQNVLQWAKWNKICDYPGDNGVSYPSLKSYLVAVYDVVH